MASIDEAHYATVNFKVETKTKALFALQLNRLVNARRRQLRRFPVASARKSGEALNGNIPNHNRINFMAWLKFNFHHKRIISKALEHEVRKKVSLISPNTPTQAQRRVISLPRSQTARSFIFLIPG